LHFPAEFSRKKEARGAIRRKTDGTENLFCSSGRFDSATEIQRGRPTKFFED
jgi:hypothetical protein